MMVDMELIDDEEYAAMGEQPAERLRTLLGKLDSVRSSHGRGSKVSFASNMLFGKFAEQIEKIFENLPKPLNLQTFYRHDLKILMDTSQEVREVADRQRLNKSQIQALEKARATSEESFQILTAGVQQTSDPVADPKRKDIPQTGIRDMSAREIKQFAEKEAGNQRQTELKRQRVSPSLRSETMVLTMTGLGFSIQSTADRLGRNRKMVMKYSGGNGIGQTVRDLQPMGIRVKEVAEMHGVPEPLVWSIALEGKSDWERFEALHWNLRYYDEWSFNDVDHRFGDDWPGRIPAQIVAHTLFYFTRQGDLVFDPMAGGGVVADTCLAMGRNCWSFDLVDRPEERPEILPHYWDPKDLRWPMKDRRKPDLIFFDPPYFSKMAGQYLKPSISNLPREEYLQFFRDLFPLFKEHTKENGYLAFLNSDWRDFPSKAAMDEDPDKSILIHDYVDIMRESGWTITHIIYCPMSTQRFQPAHVPHMRKNRTIGVVSRCLIIGRNSK
jgi:hypothetical protein